VVLWIDQGKRKAGAGTPAFDLSSNATRGGRPHLWAFGQIEALTWPFCTVPTCDSLPILSLPAPRRQGRPRDRRFSLHTRTGSPHRSGGVMSTRYRWKSTKSAPPTPGAGVGGVDFEGQQAFRGGVDLASGRRGPAHEFGGFGLTVRVALTGYRRISMATITPSTITPPATGARRLRIGPMKSRRSRASSSRR
jgi:hypothetical protein